jgi:hypothetical protein
MPRFYFHIQTIDGLNEEDDVGLFLEARRTR